MTNGTASIPDAALARRVDAVLERALGERRIVGAVVLVARDGHLAYERAVGFADREAGRPMREDAIFLLASLTKPIAAAAALALLDAGALRLDDPVTRWLPAFRPKLEDGREPVITVRHLLTHTAGLGYRFLEIEGGPYHRAGVSDGGDVRGVSLEENLRRLGSVPLLYEPGSAWGYSLASDVLGGVVARAGGAGSPAGFAEVVQRVITAPLGMKDTAFEVVDRTRLVTHYASGPKGPVPMSEPHVVALGPTQIQFSPTRIFDPDSYPSGGAGMAGTARDVLGFLEALRTGGAPILREETVAEMTRNQIGDFTSSLLRPGIGYGYGVAVVRDPSQSGSALTAGSFQWGGAYGHHGWVDPRAGVSAVILTNVALACTLGPLADDIKRAVHAP
ncbi:serine hydrolase domain-containing protein [Pendulispora albinea]|uniref:Beta-lactamase family protein n=1 Tax=Pendulispora albinea TaxID=2741071 RepID=A0ABZ2M4H2_9BACT